MWWRAGEEAMDGAIAIVGYPMMKHEMAKLVQETESATTAS